MRNLWHWITRKPQPQFEPAGSNADDRGYNDRPIHDPNQDHYAFDPFAQSIAETILRIKQPNGTVIALNGVWGSGKSSTVNLVLKRLRTAAPSPSLKIISFSSWWFRGEEALAVAFFRELYAGTAPSLTRRAKKLLPKVGARLLKAGAAVSSTMGLPGAAAGKLLDSVAGLITTDESVELLHHQLAEALRDSRT